MNLVLQPHPNWSAHDQALCKQFFATETWMKLIEMVMAARPATTGKSWEERAITGVEREAVEATMNSIAQVLNFSLTPTNPEAGYEQLVIPPTLTSKLYGQESQAASR